MEAEEDPAGPLLALFNFYWFGGPIIPSPSPSPSPSPPPESYISEPALVTHLELPPPSRPGRHRRSFSDEIVPPPASSTLPLPKLRTILSGKEGDVSVEIPIVSPGDGKAGRRRRWRRSRCRSSTGSESRSMTDLEFEELKGFMDLGFDFTNVVPTPRLMSIVPGLQRLRAAAGGEETAAVSSPSGSDGGSEESVVVRPYLSEAWEAAERRRLMKWKIPAASEGIDLKDHLRAWAQTVASTVR